MPQGRISARSVAVKAEYTVTIKMPDGTSTDLPCDEDAYILDAAEEAGVELPYSCRNGSCSSCVGMLEAGTIDQSEQTHLDDEQMDAGWVLTCIASPTSDCTVLADQEEAFSV